MLARADAQLSSDFYGQFRSGVLSTLTGDVHKVLGRAPRDFADYAHTAAAHGAWDN